MKQVVRSYYLETLKNLREQNLIKVVTGVRRCGKSTLMLQFQYLLRKENPNANILSINFDVPEFRFLAEKNWLEVYEYIKSLLSTGTINYVFLDEVQNVVQFEKLLEGLFVHPDVDLYVTGSNAYLLSSELATLLTGRAFEINVLPFSFAEYLKLTDNNNQTKAFSEFVTTGGFPEAARLAMANNTYAYQYLQTVFKNIYENDILKRYKINSEHSYNEVVNFLIDSIGSSVSATNIANVLKNGDKDKNIDNKTVSRYIETLTEAFLFYKVNRYDIKGKQHLQTQKKYYLVDTGLRNALLGKNLSSDTGYLLENVIYLELLRRGNQIWIGKVDNIEVDFTTRNKDGYTVYYQVAQTVQDPETLARELMPFDKIPDHNDKILLTMDYETGSRNGVKQINILDWLLEK
jgi:predicted AAA+ superfamily ATPase